MVASLKKANNDQTSLMVKVPKRAKKKKCLLWPHLTALGINPSLDREGDML